MNSSEHHDRALDRKGPLRILFTITSMPVGGAETLLMNLCQRFDPDRIRPELCCLKTPGPLGEVLAREIPVHSGLIDNKWDLRVVTRLRRLIRERQIDGVVTVGAGDKMFWGRVAARLERLPIVCSALHSTGWPDGIGRLNRMLTPITDAFVAVADNHGRYLVDVEGFPEEKVRVIPNGIDTDVFVKRPDSRAELRNEWGIPEEAPVVGIIAALRPEKNHEMFLKAAAAVRQRIPDSHFVIVGDGPRRSDLQALASNLNLTNAVRFLGSRSDIPAVLSALDVCALTSLNEASPVSILEALSCEVPVVAPNVGSICEMVRHGRTGFLIERDNVDQAAGYWIELLLHRGLRWRLGTAGRELVCREGSLDNMVTGYEQLLEGIFQSKVGRPAERRELVAAGSC